MISNTKLSDEIIDINYDVCEELIFIHTVHINHEYRGQGRFKQLLNNLQSQYSKPIELECWPTLIPMYLHLGFKDLGECNWDGYHLMRKEYGAE